MKGTLVKEYGDFYLISDKEIEKGDEYVKLNNRPRTLLLGTTISHVTKVSKLSLKNCEAIANGYDLDELCEQYATNPMSNFAKHGDEYVAKNSFGRGFLKALELLGDMIKCFNASMDDGWVRADFYIQSLQQTEWDVEIVMECCGKVYSQHCDGTCEHVKPLLDADGRLILKRVG